MAGCHERVEILVFSLVVTVHIKCTRQAEKLADKRGVMLGRTQIFLPVFVLCQTIPQSALHLIFMPYFREVSKNNTHF